MSVEKDRLSKNQAIMLTTFYGDELAKARLFKILKSIESDDLASLIMALMRLCDDVVKNHEDVMRLLGYINGATEKEAEDLNIPTLKGALFGIQLSDGVDQSVLCETCALRRGSIPNQCESTLNDLLYTLDDEPHFMCHEGIDGNERPTTGCRGYAQMINHRGLV